MQSSTLVYTSSFAMTMLLLLDIVFLLSSQCCAWRMGGGKEKEKEKEKKTWYKSKAQAKRLIIFQQKRVRIVGLHLYTLLFVKAHNYCPSINEDIKKL